MKSIVKAVRKYGNSGGVYVPSSWVGGRVKIELIDEPPNPKEVLDKVQLEHVISAILYGSYARGEAAEGSDIDIILVADKEISVPAELRHKYDIQVRTAKQIRDAVTHDPVFHKVVKDEAVAMLNHSFLDSLRKESLRKGCIKARLELAESSLNIIKELSRTGSLDVYPLVMRLKEVLFLEYLLADKKYSTKALKSELTACGISSRDFSDLMHIYRAARGNKMSRGQLTKETIEKLTMLLEAKINNVKQKAREKGY